MHDDGETPCPYYEVDEDGMDKAAFDRKLEELVVKQHLDRSAWTTI